MTASRPEPKRPGLRTLAVPIALLGVLALADIVLMTLWRPDVPEPLATHFDGAGRPDGFTSWPGMLATSLLLGTLLPLVLAVAFHFGGRGRMTRFGAPLATGTSALIMSVLLVSVARQRGLTDAHEARLGLGWLGFGLGCALAVGGLTYAVVPADADPPPAPAAFPRLSLRPGERAVWSSARTGRTLLVIGLVVAAGALAWTLVRREAIPGLIFVATGAVTASLAHVRVVVDERGLAWRMGLLSRRIPLSRITSAREVDVSPMAYGGWGFRLSSEGQAIVIGAGPGLRITRRDASDLTVTVPDAETGAALLNTLIGDAARPPATRRR